MSALAKVISRAFFSTSTEDDVFQQIVMFCAAGLFVSLLMLAF